MILHLPINKLSFGNVSYNILKVFYERDEKPTVLPIGEVDISAFKENPEFGDWLVECIQRGIKKTSREDKGFKLWHIQGLLESYQKTPCGFTFHETDRLTDVEVNILSQQKTIFVSSTYTKEVFENHGLDNVVYCPLGFDKEHFYKTGKRYTGKNVKSFGLYGKLENRKNTLRIMSRWIKKFGNKDGFLLNCAISNGFLEDGQFKAMVASVFPDGKQPFNVNFVPFQPTLEGYNDVLNANDIDLTGMSSCEGFNLPLFQSLCLGKQAVVLNAHVHKDFANEKNAILVEPNGNRKAEDGIFFKEGYVVNQGNWFDFKDEDLDNALDIAAENAKNKNLNGEALKDEFTWERTVDIIIKNI